MEKQLRITVSGFIFAAVALLAGCATTAQKEAELHKVVIQVSSDDAATQTLAMNNAVNLQQAIGMDNISIEIVAYGPGLLMLMEGSKNSQRVSSLAKQDIVFSACGNTMKKVEAKQGKPVMLSEGVRVVPAGVQRIMELEELGYSYVRP